MNVLNVKPLRVLACGAVAVVLTAFGSYAFVSSTAVVRTAAYWVPAVASATHTASIHVARSSATGLLQ
ncbi:MAG TPA: hypothetical protein VG994_10475 [Steroidobacteraceae bacterium]|nr:hypothetical protein [Steroidobacteraceae bacterium]